MSKKDLLERISRSGADATPRSAGPTRNVEAPSEGKSTTKRVSRRVVRRRPKRGGEEPEAVAAAPVAEPAAPAPKRKRAAAKPKAKPAEAPVEAAAAPEAPAEPTAPEAPAPVEAVAATPEPVEAPPEPVAAAPEPVAPAEAPPAAAEPAPEAQPVAAAPEEALKDAAVPTEPAFVGLGSAVVRPPPGYDPSNPNAWRRRMEAQNQAAAAPAAPTDAGARRRRVAAGGGGADRGRSRGRDARDGGRGGRVPGDMMMRKRRRGGKKGATGSSTVAMKAEKRKVRIDNVISVGQLSHEMGLKATEVIRQLMELGSMVTVNQMLDFDTATLVAAEFEYETENVGFQEDKILQHFDVEEDEGTLAPRSPVVTVMGHVDHGKTTLLDAIREARVAAGEAGGITQHIGAYQVVRNGESITFLDTPGHAAFTAMRARGAQVTDIVVLVVAADDGVQPQTVEAINHAKAAEVPIIVAVNKMDKAGVSAEPIMQALTQYGLQSETWGGDVQVVPVSALKGQGIDELLEAIQLQTEILELKAPIDRPAEGIVIEAKVERGRGPVATVLIQKGEIRQGDNVVLGSAFGRVRAMVDHRGKRIKIAGPSTPVEIFGISEVPSTGDIVTVVKNEKDARAVADHRADQKRQAQFGAHTRRTAEDLFAAAAADATETLHVVLKADVQGSLEALKGALEGIEIAGTELRLLHTGVGNINESDVNLVMANGGLLIGFNVRIDANARRTADENGVKSELYTVIYDVIDRVTAAMEGMVEPELEEVRQGSVEVRALFKISRLGTVAGSYVLDGKVGRNSRVRVMRDGEELWDGAIGTLKRFKDDVREVSAGYECGIVLDGFHDLAEGDVFEVYSMETVKRA